MSNHNLFIHRADGSAELASNQDILAAARAVLAHRVRRGALLQTPEKVGEYLATRVGYLDYECFGLILVDGRHRVIDCVELFRGTIDGASVYPREVVKLVLDRQAAAAVCYHNHPLCFVWRVATPIFSMIFGENRSIRHRRKNGMGSCPVSSDRITPVSLSRRLRFSRAVARSVTRRVAMRPACDGCAAA